MIDQLRTALTGAGGVFGTFLWTMFWQSSLWLGVGLLAAWLWRKQAARAHLALLLAAAAAFLSPVFTAAVRHMQWGVLPAVDAASVPQARPEVRVSATEPAAFSGTSAQLNDSIDSMERTDIAPAQIPHQPARALESISAPSPAALSARRRPWVQTLRDNLPLAIASAWAISSLALFVRLVTSLLVGRRLVRHGRAEAHAALSAALHAASTRLSLRVEPALRTSVAVLCPVIWCWGRRPIVLVPQSAAKQTNVRWRDVFCHELAHWLRRDHWASLATELLLVALPWQPLAWRARRRLSYLREQACDDWVLAAGGRSTDYANSLLDLVPQRSSAYALPAVSSGQSLRRRLEHILAGLRVAPAIGRRWVAAASILALSAVAGVGFAQQGKRAASSPAPSQAPQAAGEMVRPSEAMKQSAEDAGGRLPAPKESVPAQSEHKYAGHITDSNGHPIGQAKVFLTWVNREAAGLSEPWTPLREVAITDQQGNFAFGLTPQFFDEAKLGQWMTFATLIAQAPGFGLDWDSLEPFADPPVAGTKPDSRLRRDKATPSERSTGTFQLPPEEQPVHGHLVDLEGRPLPNVAVDVERIARPDIKTLLQAFERSDKRLLYQAYNQSRAGSGHAVLAARALVQRLLPSVATDSRGDFTLHGIGRDQLVTLSFRAEGVESPTIFVLGRSMQPARLPHLESYPHGYQDFFAGREFSYPLGPSVPVSGVVKDYDTGRAVPGTVVAVERLFAESNNRDNKLRLDCEHLRCISDKEGRFRIDGLPPGDDHVLNAVPPKQEPYLMAEQRISPKLGEAKHEIEIRLKKVLWLEGRVTDKATGKPVKSFADYLALQSNPNTLDKLGLRQAWQMHRYVTDDQGRYRIPGLPGPGVLLVSALDRRDYPLAVGAERVKSHRDNWIPTTPVGYPLSNWNLIEPIDPPKGAIAFHRDVVLDAGQTIPGRVLGPVGEPTSHLQVLGEVLNAPFWNSRADSQFEVKGYDGKGPRQLIFKSSDEMLVGHYRLVGQAPREIVVELDRAVRVKGRLFERQTGEPAERYGVYCDSSSLGEFPIDAPTDDTGQFEIKGLIAGLVYKMNAANPQHFVSNKNRFTIDLKNAKPGDAIELGDVGGVTKSGSAAAGSASPEASRGTSASSVEPRQPAGVQFSGRVVHPDGSPAAGAQIFFTRSDGPAHGIELKATSDTSGHFDFSIPTDTLFGVRWLRVVAVKPGFGPGWVDADELKKSSDLTLRLATDDLPIEGHLLNLEGRPVSGAQVRVDDMTTFANDDPKPYLEALKTDDMRASNFGGLSWLMQLPPGLSAQTDEHGFFRLAGVGRHRRAQLTINGDGIADTRIYVVTEPLEGLLNRYQMDRLTRPAYGAHFTHHVRPSRPIVGTVTDAKTGQPIKGARVAQLDGLSPATTDASGRFMLRGCAKADTYTLLASPPDGLSYIGGSLLAHDKPGLDPLRVELHVFPSILLTGRVIDSVTGKPVDAEVQYWPLYPNPYIEEGLAGGAFHGGGPCSQSRCNSDGTFSLGVMPGPGALVVSMRAKSDFEPAHVDAKDFFEKHGVLYGNQGVKSSGDVLLIAVGTDGVGGLWQHQFQGIALLNVSETAKHVMQDVTVHSKAKAGGNQQ